MNNPYVLEFTLKRDFGKARYYPSNQLATVMLQITGNRSLTYDAVLILSEHFETYVREGQMLPVRFVETKGDL